MSEALGPKTLARATGVSTDTLRHYERLGLLRGTARTRSGYRRYPAESIARVLLIQRALIVGFTLKELKDVLAERDSGGVPCRRVYDLVAEKLGSLDRQIDTLNALKTEVQSLLDEWSERLRETPSRPAHLLETLANSRTIEGERTSAGCRKVQPRKR
jgi:DNA-binding transcriptional MerR regulator